MATYDKYNVRAESHVRATSASTLWAR